MPQTMRYTLPQPTCCPSADESEPLTGNVFVAAYPPFSCWSPQQVPAALDRLHSPWGGKDDRPLGLYVHVPFCAKRCDFCYYQSYDDQGRHIDAYLDAVVRELGLCSQLAQVANRAPRFVYFGGGTPSLLSVRRIDRLLRGVREAFSWDAVKEATFECAPRTMTLGKLKTLREMGVTRISMGVQQLDDRVLRANGRVHLSQDVMEAYDLIQSVGFPVVNLDLIAGMVGETDDSFLTGLDRVIGMRPDTVTIYQMEIPRNTPLYQMWPDERMEEPLPDAAVRRRRVGFAFTRLESAGYTVVNAYTAARDPMRHLFHYVNDQYRGADVMGIGVSSFSYVNGTHFQNLSGLAEYLNAMRQADTLPVARAYVLEELEQLVRLLVLQLKLGEADLASLSAQFDIDVAALYAPSWESLIANRWARWNGHRVRLTREGLLRVDRLLPSFYLPNHQDKTYW